MTDLSLAGTPPAISEVEPELLAAWLAARGVKLVGLDVPSVDRIDSKDLLIHHACDAVNLLILENLDLRAIEPGVYELIALPLRIKGGDGSPLRAVLRSATGGGARMAFTIDALRERSDNGLCFYIR